VPCGAYQVVRRLARDAGLPHPERVHPHALRHTAVTLALAAGAQLSTSRTWPDTPTPAPPAATTGPAVVAGPGPRPGPAAAVR